MFLSEALLALPEVGHRADVPELTAYAEALCRGVATSPSTKIAMLAASFLLKQSTIWDRVVAYGWRADVLERVLGFEQSFGGEMPGDGGACIIRNRAVSKGVLEIQVDVVELDSLFVGLPAPRALVIGLFGTMDGALRALRMRADHPNADFSTVVLFKSALSETDGLQAMLAVMPHRVVGWLNSTGVSGEAEIVGVIATGPQAYEV